MRGKFMLENERHREMTDALIEQDVEKKSAGSSGRLYALKIVLFLAFIGITVRLVQIQIVDSPQYRGIAQRQYETKVVLPAARGCIYDRNGNVLASNTVYVSFAANPKVVDKEASLVADKFSEVFGKPKKHYLDKLQTSKRFVWLERQVQPELANQLQGKGLRGIAAFNEPKRLYHYQGIGEPLIGFTDIDNVGLSGAELQYEKQLRGVDGCVVMQRDGYGRAHPSMDYLRVEPTNGSHIFLTIDLVYQSIAEDKLKGGIGRNRADGGLVVMMNPRTGEILALAQSSGADPRSSADRPPDKRKLRAVTDMFEPGSVFKIVTVAAALEHEIVKPEQKFHAEHGVYEMKLFDGTTQRITDTHEYDIITFRQAMEYSSNIVMAKVSNLLGSERLYRTARDFGFGSETGIEYPGEAKGELKRPKEWSGTTLNTMAYGYEVGVTPIQIISAYGTVANNGLMMKPTLIKKIVNESGVVLEERNPEPIRQVISHQTAATLTEFFEGVVQRGTATTAQIEGVRIAGKTGTSRRYLAGRYETDNYTASFVGFFPVEDPEIVCLVMLDNPRVGGYTGGATAAPIFQEIARHVVTTGKTVVPKSNSFLLTQFSHSGVKVPDVFSLHPDVARSLLKSRGLASEVFGEGIVVRQIPEAETLVEQGSSVTLLLNNELVGSSEQEIMVPNLCGLSVRRAVNRLAMDRLEPKIQGSGIVVRQVPPAGEHVAIGSSIALVCEPPRPDGISENN